MSTKKKQEPESIIREIKRKTRRKYTSEEKTRIVLEGLHGESSIADVSRKTFLEACKKRLTGDTVREADATAVKDHRAENEALKQVFAEWSLENQVLKKP